MAGELYVSTAANGGFDVCTYFIFSAQLIRLNFTTQKFFLDMNDIIKKNIITLISCDIFFTGRPSNLPEEKCRSCHLLVMEASIATASLRYGT